MLDDGNGDKETLGDGKGDKEMLADDCLRKTVVQQKNLLKGLYKKGFSLELLSVIQ